MESRDHMITMKSRRLTPLTNHGHEKQSSQSDVEILYSFKTMLNYFTRLLALC